MKITVDWSVRVLLIQDSRVEEVDPRNKASTIDAFHPFQNIKDQEERTDLNEAFSFGAPFPSRNSKPTLIKVRKINPNVARNLARFGKPFSGSGNFSAPTKKTKKYKRYLHYWWNLLFQSLDTVSHDSVHIMYCVIL